MYNTHPDQLDQTLWIIICTCG